MQAKLILLAAASPVLLTTMASAQTTPTTQATPTTPQPTQAAPAPQGQPTQSQTAPQPGQVVAATAADLKAGAKVLGKDGSEVGTIESVAPGGVVIATGKARVQIPTTSFGKNERGLVLATTKAELEAAATKESGNS